MGIRINTNVQSLVAQRSLGKVSKAQNDNFEKLSSGQRINKASDDAAGLAISEKMKAHIRGNQQAERNANDGVSMVQVAEGGLNEVSNILVRLRELSVQAASDTVGDGERKFTDMEFKNLTQEVDRIANSTQFNGKSLLSGQGDKLDFQIGIHNSDEYDRLSYSPSQTDARSSALKIDSMSVATKEGAQSNLESIDTAISKISENRANLGALQNRMQSTINNIQVLTENLSAANSRIRDTDMAQASAELAKNQVLSAASTSVLAQANVSSQTALKLIG